MYQQLDIFDLTLPKFQIDKPWNEMSDEERRKT